MITNSLPKTSMQSSSEVSTRMTRRLLQNRSSSASTQGTHPPSHLTSTMSSLLPGNSLPQTGSTSPRDRRFAGNTVAAQKHVAAILGTLFIDCLVTGAHPGQHHTTQTRTQTQARTQTRRKTVPQNARPTRREASISRRTVPAEHSPRMRMSP